MAMAAAERAVARMAEPLSALFLPASRYPGPLLDLAWRLPAPARVERLELLLAERAVTHLARGEAAVPVRLTSAAADAARVQAVQH